VVLTIGETEVMVVAGDRPLDRGPLARSEIRRAGVNEFLLLIEGRGWQIRVDNATSFVRKVAPRFGGNRFIRFRAWRASSFGLRDPSDGTLRVTPWSVVTGLAWVVVLLLGFGLGRWQAEAVGVVMVVAIAVVAIIGLRWVRPAPREVREASPPASVLLPAGPEPVAHSTVNVGMAGDVDLVREILGDRLAGRQKLVTPASRPVSRQVPEGSIPAPPGFGEAPGIERPVFSSPETGQIPPLAVGEDPSAAERVPLDGGVNGTLPPEADDLTTIRGIGPRLATRLAAVGVVTFRQLAELGEADIARLRAELGTFVHRMEKDRWQEQAREAHARKYGG
jgi:hypothetical protein